MDIKDEALSPRVMVGWSSPVSIDMSDMVTLRLLEALLSGSSVGEVVEQVMASLVWV